jgi:hypothetical protein
MIGGWITLLLGLVAALGIAGTAFTDSTRLPASDSSTADTLPGKAGSDAASAKDRDDRVAYRYPVRHLTFRALDTRADAAEGVGRSGRRARGQPFADG